MYVCMYVCMRLFDFAFSFSQDLLSSNERSHSDLMQQFEEANQRVNRLTRSGSTFLSRNIYLSHRSYMLTYIHT